MVYFFMVIGGCSRFEFDLLTLFYTIEEKDDNNQHQIYRRNS